MKENTPVNGDSTESVPQNKQCYSYKNQDDIRKKEEGIYPKEDKKRQYSIEEIREKFTQTNVEAKG